MLGSAALAGNQQPPGETPSVKEVLEGLRLAPGELRAGGAVPDSLDPPVLHVKGEEAELVAARVTPEVLRLADGNGTFLANALSWTCPSDKLSDLYLDATTPFKARSITFGYSDINWQAGNGWPVYSGRCPREDYGQGTYYRHAKVHALVHSIGSTYSISCLQSGIFTVAESGQVRCAVNDGGGDYGDNRGTFRFVVTSFSP